MNTSSQSGSYTIRSVVVCCKAFGFMYSTQLYFVVRHWSSGRVESQKATVSEIMSFHLPLSSTQFALFKELQASEMLT